ncbi:ATP-dependent DNA helicase [Trichonephila clavipes]|nr:ATP-dependent DNA helicase [Trichonephila clavipes]
MDITFNYVKGTHLQVHLQRERESERLRYIQCNQKELRVEEYIYLRDAVVSEGGLTHTSHYSQEYFVPIKSIKYVCKYINKGSDIALFDVTSSDGNTCNEVYQYEIGRHISSNEAVWRILNFPIHECYPTVIHLSVHLENGQRVHFTEGNAAERARFAPETTFIAYFNICNVDDFARTLFYHQIPRYYTWDSKNKMWSRRKIGQSLFHHPGIRSTDAIGRVYTVHPNNCECFHLRLLLPEVPGPTSFQYLKTIEDYL